MKPKLRLVLAGVLFLFLGLLEHCSGPLWWDCNPPYLLCCVAVFSMFAGQKSAALFGLAAGLFADFTASGVFGVRAVLYLSLGYLIVFLGEKVLSRNIFTVTLTGVLCVALGEISVWGVVCLGRPEAFAVAAQYVFLPRVAMSIPVVLLLYLFFVLLFGEKEPYSPRRRRRR